MEAGEVGEAKGRKESVRKSDGIINSNSVYTWGSEIMFRFYLRSEWSLPREILSS